MFKRWAAITVGRNESPHWIERISRYGCAGVIGTAVHYGLMWSLISAVTPVLATTAGAILGCLANYVLARTFVFYSPDSVNATLPRFLAVGSLCVLVNALVVHLLIPLMPVFPTQLVATICVFLLGFLLNKTWTFHA